MFSRLVQQRARLIVAAIVRPLARLGITPNTVTLLGLLLSIVTAAVIASGYIIAGGVLVLFAGIFDMFDGAMARVRNAATTFGAFLDSTLDRYSESIILAGLLYYALQRPGLHEALWPWADEQQWMIALIFVAAVGSLMVSYTKARAEGLGLECKTGLLARPERVVLLAIGFLTGTTIWALTLLAVLSHVTAIERIIHVWRAAKQVGKKQAVEQLPADKPARGTDKKDVPGRPLPIAADDQGGASANSVSTGLPPLTGSMRHD
ncbi:MAG TPA: CDP-alcohol phosphatidyltransferase family protein [Ktedonobacteraceae bacterium]|jgi:CDP-diacylglycerol--glycerol-3-phosphate 3-phosphatidyltransferase|nr:CDP-alcohol phosphatidyltransferase family protein [Ktedonobacteraceae bacterium]